MTRIIVDADACPVKSEIAAAARAYETEVIMVASFDHRIAADNGVKVIQVDRSDQSVDLYISNHIRGGDIVITQDFGLAAVSLGKKALVMSFRGQSYSDENIDFLLARRHEQAKARRGGMRTKGPRALTEEDRKNFLHHLTKVLENCRKTNGFSE